MNLQAPISQPNNIIPLPMRKRISSPTGRCHRAEPPLACLVSHSPSLYCAPKYEKSRCARYAHLCHVIAVQIDKGMSLPLFIISSIVHAPATWIQFMRIDANVRLHLQYEQGWRLLSTRDLLWRYSFVLMHVQYCKMVAEYHGLGSQCRIWKTIALSNM